MSQPSGNQRAGSGWEPLKLRVFRGLFVATTVSNVGSWMQDVGRAWLMTELTPSPLYVALVQTSAMAAMLLFSLPAGAAADSGNRRTLLIIAQGWMMTLAALMGALTLMNAMTPSLLLVLTFGSAAGAALTGPVWQAALPDIVGREQLSSAVTLNGLSFNIARAAGPALGGLIVAISGPAAVFLLNAASFAGVLLALWIWKPVGRVASAAPETWGLALRSGLRYVRHAPPLRNVLVRVVLFALPASSLWALLPVIARQETGAASGYGLLLTLIGVGAVATALLFPVIRSKISDSLFVLFAALLLALGLALAPNLDAGIRSLSMIASGIGWLAALTILTLACQAATPDWVRGRAMSIFLLVFAAAMTIGIALWGTVAESVGASATIRIAAGCQVAAALVSIAIRLPAGDNADGEGRERAWPAADISSERELSHGPVYITVQYEVRPDCVDQFVQVLAELGVRRRAEGSLRWSCYQHGSESSRYIETNEVATWGEHLRQRERGSRLDVELEAQIATLLAPDTLPIVAHWFAPKRPTSEIDADAWSLHRIVGRA
jgi:MFS family permease